MWPVNKNRPGEPDEGTLLVRELLEEHPDAFALFWFIVPRWNVVVSFLPPLFLWGGQKTGTARNRRECIRRARDNAIFLMGSASMVRAQHIG